MIEFEVNVALYFISIDDCDEYGRATWHHMLLLKQFACIAKHGLCFIGR